MFYRVRWSQSDSNTKQRLSSRTYLAEREDAWELWRYLTSMSEMEGPVHHLQVSRGQESILSSAGYKPPITDVKIYNLDGYEVCPEKGLCGMDKYR